MMLRTLKPLRGKVMNMQMVANKFCSSEVISAQQQANNKQIAYWLFGMSGLVAGMVTVGGITRLTKSGLSMTDWKIQGSLPPRTPEEWEKEFDRYKQFPEWQQRQSMTVEEFKYIYFWEYGHRMMGRALGVAFVLPMGYFAARKMIPKSLYPRLFGLLGLGGSQGLIGWWMVRSGLGDDVKGSKKEIRVSPYRLATHLGMAFTTFTCLLWTGLDLLNPKANLKSFAEKLPSAAVKYSREMSKFSRRNVFLVGATVLSGAFVAGNDAGRAFNSFPLMGDTWIPQGILELEPKWRNFFENTATVQFDHRYLAMGTYLSLSTMALQAYNRTVVWNLMPSLTRHAVKATFLVANAQVALGISTLLLYVPIELAALHQFGSLCLLTCSIVLAHSLKFSKYGKILTRKKAMPMGRLADISKVTKK
mmetsp:Transcript_35220/g.65686  ORF Transcript_35220/g.65686 Transcript_35220/m.65686 type:complete len:419 (+) Transcript_35220:59-1315(+)